MVPIPRLALHRSAEIPASAVEVWALLTDWAGMLRWSGSAGRDGPFGALVGCDLVGEPDGLPRTRRMRLASGAVVDEELVHRDDRTRRIHYRKADTSGTTGYVATSHVDAIDGRRCRLHIASWCDGPPGGDASAAVARFEAVYDGIFDGFRAYFSA